ncbi:BRCT domain protein, partial [Reticulomyxa filosa]
YKEQIAQAEEIRKALVEEHEEQMKMLDVEKEKQVERLDTDQSRTQKELDKVIHENMELHKVLDERETTMYKLQQRVNSYTLVTQEKKVLEAKYATLQREHEQVIEKVDKLQTLLQKVEMENQQLNEVKEELEEFHSDAPKSPQNLLLTRVHSKEDPSFA